MKISVAMCTYNGEKFINKQLDSILNQSSPVNEIIICDDGSKDNTINIINNYIKNSNIKINLYVNRKNLGVVDNFIKAFSKCTGDVIFLCDQDDIWTKDKVKIIVNEFNKNKEINMIGTNALLIDQDDNSLNNNLWDFVGYKYESKNYKTNYKIQLKKAILTGATAAARTSFIKKYMTKSKYVIHDYWLSECACMTNSLFMIDKNLTLYRQHSNNVVGVKKRNKLKFYLNKIFNVKNNYKFYKKNYNQYLELYNYFNDNNLSLGDNKKYLEDCIYFWYVRSNLEKYNIKQVLNELKSFRKNDFYKKYSFKHQKCATAFDLYYYFIIKIFGRSKNEEKESN